MVLRLSPRPTIVLGGERGREVSTSNELSLTPLLVRTHYLRAGSVTVLVAGHLHAAMSGYCNVAKLRPDVKPDHRHNIQFLQVDTALQSLSTQELSLIRRVYIVAQRATRNILKLQESSRTRAVTEVEVRRSAPFKYCAHAR